jgi:hypothetical protein
MFAGHRRAVLAESLRVKWIAGHTHSAEGARMRFGLAHVNDGVPIGGFASVVITAEGMAFVGFGFHVR